MKLGRSLLAAFLIKAFFILRQDFIPFRVTRPSKEFPLRRLRFFMERRILIMAKHFLRFTGVDFGYETSPELLFINIDLHFSPGWTGVVGANGAGKSTLLRLACGDLLPSAGNVSAPVLSIYCPQRTDNPPDGLDDLFDSTIREAALIKAKLGLDENWPDQWDKLSHGERKRLQIGAALFREPDVLAVDEPTNHLDAPARDVLMAALEDYKGIGILVSHDRELLDRLCSAAVFVSPPDAVLRPGNYSEASREAAREETEQARQRQKAADELARLQRTWSDRRREASRAGARQSKRKLSRQDRDGREKIDRARVTGQDAARGRMQKQMEGRLKQALTRLDGTGFTKKHPAGIEVTGEEYRGDTLVFLPAGSLSLGPGRNLIHPDLYVRPGDRISLTGPNGSGKSTLVQTIMEGMDLPEDRQLYMPQEISVRESSFVMEQARELSGENLGWVMNMVSRLGSRPERLLESRLPSPGEVRKLLLSLGLLGKPWLVVLDEPTNHLDLPSIERLEAALAGTQAALLLVSHDRPFLLALTSTAWEIEPEESDYILRVH
jgi:macrolide transport system ATP-binding/permease protein